MRPTAPALGDMPRWVSDCGTIVVYALDEQAAQRRFEHHGFFGSFQRNGDASLAETRFTGKVLVDGWWHESTGRPANDTNGDAA